MFVTHIEEVPQKAINGVYTVRVWTKADKLAFCLSQMKKIEGFLASMQFEYSDNRGNIAESLEYAAYIIDNLEDHAKDIKEGTE
ncbi:MAG: hypothetical protein Q8924_12285 [Bacillota bacterium]|nr:hypothetical protein [Bacillota bacterium]